MERLATFVWRTPPPTSIDERLILYDDGSAWLVVRRPAVNPATMGSFAYSPERAVFDELVRSGPGPVEFDMRHQPPATADLQIAARRIADAARQAPVATATFHGRPFGPSSGEEMQVSMMAVAAGQRAVEFELDPAACAVHFSNMGQPVAWRDLPRLEVGFVTPLAESLGGLGMRARIEPEQWGSTVFEVPAQAGATAVWIQVAGWLYDPLPDREMPSRFEVRTDEMDLGPLA